MSKEKEKKQEMVKQKRIKKIRKYEKSKKENGQGNEKHRIKWKEGKRNRKIEEMGGKT